MEPKYEELAIDAHYYNKRPWTNKDFNPWQKPFFFYKHCDENFKDNNTLLWHRFRGVCLVYEGPKPLKVYSTWERNDASELWQIWIKFGLVKLPPLVPVQVKQPLPQKIVVGLMNPTHCR